MVQRVPESSLIGIDGTFKVSPLNSFQVVIFIGRTLFMNFPIFYLLLPDKKEITYNLAFNLYLNCLQRFGCNFMENVKFVCDFEQALINAINQNFMQSKSHLQLCYFHFTQTLRKYKQEFKKNQNEFAIDLLKIIKLLPLIEINSARNFINFLSKFTGVNEELNNFINYFQETYTKTFPINLWNTTGKPMKDRVTNNANESFNKKLNNYINIHKPSLQEFFVHIQTLENGQKNRYLNYQRDEKFPRKFLEEPFHNENSLFLFNLKKIQSKYEIFEKALKEENTLDFGIREDPLEFCDIEVVVPVIDMEELLRKNRNILNRRRKNTRPFIPRKTLIEYKNAKTEVERNLILSKIKCKGRWKDIAFLRTYVNREIKKMEKINKMNKNKN